MQDRITYILRNQTTLYKTTSQGRMAHLRYQPKGFSEQTFYTYSR